MIMHNSEKQLYQQTTQQGLSGSRQIVYIALISKRRLLTSLDVPAEPEHH